jgi:hypothetical protein
MQASRARAHVDISVASGCVHDACCVTKLVPARDGRWSMPGCWRKLCCRLVEVASALTDASSVEPCVPRLTCASKALLLLHSDAP